MLSDFKYSNMAGNESNEVQMKDSKREGAEPKGSEGLIKRQMNVMGETFT